MFKALTHLSLFTIYPRETLIIFSAPGSVKVHNNCKNQVSRSFHPGMRAALECGPL